MLNPPRLVARLVARHHAAALRRAFAPAGGTAPGASAAQSGAPGHRHPAVQASEANGAPPPGAPPPGAPPSGTPRYRIAQRGGDASAGEPAIGAPPSHPGANAHPLPVETAAVMLADIARFALEGMGRADAPYHDADHVVAVSEAARLIVAGRHAAGEAVGVEDWLHMVAAALMHDLGYVRGLCPGDGEGRVMTGCGEASVAMPESATDAWLAPYHVDRGIRVARARYTGVAGLDVDRLARAIDATRFPPPHGRGAAAGAAADGTEPGLVRAADLIGQFADLHYPRKVAALYAEFAETGEAAVQGYASPADIWSGFPAFFETVVAPRIGPALAYLDRTAEGRACRARLELNLSRARAGAPRHVVE